MSLADNYIFKLDENVTRKPVSCKNRFGITISENLASPSSDAVGELVGSKP